MTISNRIKKLFFWTYSLSVLLVLLIAWLLLESLEETTLELDRQVEIEHFLSRHDTDKIVHVKSAMLTLTYLPPGSSEVSDLPIIFRGLPIPFEGEIDFLDKEYLVIVNRIAEGTYYLAKDLTLFSQHENLMIEVLLVLAVLSLALGYGLSLFMSRLISQPIKQLTNDIHGINDDRASLPVDYQDDELNDICRSFNMALAHVHAVMERERSLLSMASHELRTPIAVILGAAEVIERRQQLHPNDSKTLARIIDAAQLMSSNVQALLLLARQPKEKVAVETFCLLALLVEVKAAIFSENPMDADRIDITGNQALLINSNKTMVRMALVNLINNALKHNQGSVFVVITTDSLLVFDEGIQRSDNSNINWTNESTGLGLYIVTLICEKLAWRFSFDAMPDGRSCAKLMFGPFDEAPVVFESTLSV